VRIALISMAAEGSADVRLAGHPLAWHQVQTAIALACERVVCLADRPGPELAAVQREAERRGATFHAVTHHRALSGLVRAADTLLVLAPGVLPDSDWLAQTFGARAGVAVLPAEGAVEQGFERIDRDRAWAGVLATRGDAVEALGVLPPDADPIAGLLRVALQRGATAIEVPRKWLDNGRWALVATPAGSERYQSAWYARHVPAPALDRPGAALAYRIGRSLVGRAGSAERVAMGFVAGGVVTALASGAAGYLGRVAAGSLGLLVASALLAVGTAVGRLSRAGTGERARRWPEKARHALLDLSLVTIAASPSAFEGWTTAFAAFVLVAVVRLACEPDVPRVFRPFSDRTLVLAVLALAAIGGIFEQALAALALVGLALRLFGAGKKQLTQA
jgi:hypothetical protein